MGGGGGVRFVRGVKTGGFKERVEDRDNLTTSDLTLHYQETTWGESGLWMMADLSQQEKYRCYKI